MPLSDSEDSLLLDLFGTSRTITVEGIKTGTVSELRTFISDIEGLQDGDQDSMVFVSSWTNSNKNVLIQDFSHTKSKADESKVNYSITLVQGSVI